MISEKMNREINNQLMFELSSGHLYLAMAAYCSSIDLEGFANFFIIQEKEERFHAMKFYNYISEQSG
ncbi:MAG: ferritin, partial [Calditrichia bacterium]|nr:ferritin [Calditrichia bacterium]